MTQFQVEESVDDSPFSQRFRPSHRFHDPSDFMALRGAPLKFHFQDMAVFARPGNDSWRLGVTVPKAFGNAAQRNRFKRQVREFFRTHQMDLNGYDFHVLPRWRRAKAAGLEKKGPPQLEGQFHSFLNRFRQSRIALDQKKVDLR